VPRPSWRYADPYLNGVEEGPWRHLRQGKAFGSSALDAFSLWQHYGTILFYKTHNTEHADSIGRECAYSMSAVPTHAHTLAMWSWTWDGLKLTLLLRGARSFLQVLFVLSFIA